MKNALVEKFADLGFVLEETGGGCTAFVKRVGAFAVCVTDGDFCAPESEGQACEVAILNGEENTEECYGARDFGSVEEAIDYLASAGGVLGIFAGLTIADVEYARAGERKAARGFAALHDLMDANDLLPGADGDDFDTDAANAVMAEWNRLVLG